jgi:hypothetical protein
MVVRGAVCGQRLDRDMSAERFLDRLVDHTHAAATDLSQDAVLAQLPRCGLIRRFPHAVELSLWANRSEYLHEQHRRKQLPNLGGQFRMGIGVIVERRLHAAPQTLDELMRQFVQSDRDRTRVVHQAEAC